MYFEARSHQSVQVSNSTAAVMLIHSDVFHSYQCPVWKNKAGHRIALVDDSHIDNAWLEVAVVNLDTKEQYESITFGWCDLAKQLTLVAECENGENVFRKDITLPIDGAGKDAPVRFTCSCCGSWFTSTLKEQEKHDQDAGFGHCPKCFR